MDRHLFAECNEPASCRACPTSISSTARWRPSVGGGTMESFDPGQRQPARHVRGRRRRRRGGGRRSRPRRAGEGAWKRTLPRERGRILSRTAELIREQRRAACHRRGAGQRQDHCGSARRRRGRGPLLRLLCRRGRQERRPQLSARRRLCFLLDQRAGRRHRPHHSLELSALDRRPQRRAGAGGRLHGRRQARRADADDGADAGGTARQGRPA